jgi:plasmid stability protein
VKRLTLDLPVDVHRALKVRSAELEVPMADLLRELLDDAMKKPTTLRQIATRLHSRSTKDR